MDKIPWTEIGIGGALAIIMICVVLTFLLKWKKNGDKPVRPPCLSSPEVKQAMLNNILIRENIERIERHLDKISDNAVKQTGFLKEIAQNGRRRSQ